MYMKGTGLGMVTLASNPGILLTKYFTLSSETRVNLPDDENTEWKIPSYSIPTFLFLFLPFAPATDHTYVHFLFFSFSTFANTTMGAKLGSRREEGEAISWRIQSLYRKLPGNQTNVLTFLNVTV